MESVGDEGPENLIPHVCLETVDVFSVVEDVVNVVFSHSHQQVHGRLALFTCDEIKVTDNRNGK